MPPTDDGASTTPEPPDPRRVLEEARLHAAKGHYQTALDKHVWFHHYALSHEPSLYGVRLSYALRDWVGLGSVYPPALAKLREIRDECEETVRGGRECRAAFSDFSAINHALTEEERTTQLFAWMDAHAPASAAEVFDVAQEALVQAKAFALCGRYLTPDQSFERLRMFYRRKLVMAEDPKFGERFRQRAERSFASGTATLVALLALNGRAEDAERIATEALAEWDEAGFQAQLERARRGELPPTSR